MSVLVKGMEKPEHCGYCRFRYDGICHALQKTQYSMDECPLVVIDDAGLNDTISTNENGYCSQTERRECNLTQLSERKNGNWVGIDDEPCETFECDVCGFVLEDWIQGALYRYCPNCGAWMGGGDWSYRIEKQEEDEE